MQVLKSKTIIFNMVMAGIEFLHASIQILEPVVSVDMFIYLSMGIGLVHSVGGVYLRTVTTKPLADKCL